ncbi:MAG TPA: HD-GYP domain-containing protein [Gaiellaceae bacterium]|nr:HD-GYP domain-containing protein [Gaiellaceae bacterium]
MLRRPVLPTLAVLSGCSVVPIGLLAVLGKHTVLPPLWVHFYGVGVTALVATAAAVTLTVLGARSDDARTVVVGGAFALMAALLAVHGFMTPGVIMGQNGLISLTGGATLPVGAFVLMLSSRAWFTRPDAIPTLIVITVAAASAIHGVSVVGAVFPSVVPAVPEPGSLLAYLLLGVTLAAFGALAVRAANTYLLTQRLADLAVVAGMVLLAASAYGALVLSFTELGWWLGHIFEVAGIALVGASVGYDLRRGRRSRPLVGDLRASEIVASEEAFLGARVRALMVRLAAKDESTEEHTRRVAGLAVELGEQLGLSRTRLRSLAIGGLLHDIGKLSIPDSILQKPGALDDDEFAVIKLHPERGRELLGELGGFDESITRLVHDHHERLDGRGYPRGLQAGDLDLATRILAVCDVYDALVSPRVYRDAWPVEKALSHLAAEAGTSFDERCVGALVRLVEGESAARATAPMRRGLRGADAQPA